ncbi:MAG: glycosyltransferase family 2 protein [Lachnospiraceae bacterium]|nr:glycosyltransferase family 2 protein [Lachnospiraceae bacterium]
MKLLSIAVPCYNSENYMEHCVESLLAGGDEVEILIVDDGSKKDRTPEIADRLEREHPGIVRAIHQENGGHGEAVNTGLKNATGVYFKVVDSDDWVNEAAYKQILDLLRDMVQKNTGLDMLLSNFVYEKEGAKHKKVMNYHAAIPRGEIITWEQVRGFTKWQYILMHSVIYRTQLLRDCGLKLPSHTFYVDNIFVYQPLPYVKTLYYLDVNFYRYYIGREDQSVNEKVMISRIDQQLRVNKIMIDEYNLYDRKLIPSRKLRHYMMQYLEIMMTISSIMLIRSGTEENLEKKKELWKYLKKKDGRLYFRLRHGIMGRTMNLPGKGGRKVSEMGYKITQKFFGFN